MRAISHPNVICVRDVLRPGAPGGAPLTAALAPGSSSSSAPGCIYIMLTRVAGGDLFDLIQARGHLEEHAAKFFFFQLLRALFYLHAHNIAHRDLKPENLLLEAPEPFARLFVTDFGMAKVLAGPGSFSRTSTRCGTFSYLAPEVLAPGARGYQGQRVDCWSCGVLLYAMLSGTLPFGNEADQGTLVARIRAGEYGFAGGVWEGGAPVSAEARDLIARCLVVDPEARITVKGMLAHPWIARQRALLEELYERAMRRSLEQGGPPI
jgi:serine/threonine protein kinase